MSHNYKYLTDMLRQKSGISIGDDKHYLLDTRLRPIATKNGFKNIEEMAASLQSSPNTALIEEIVDAMTTNESLFFRDTKPFDQTKRLILPKFQGKRLRIWSAAASTGQEAYSLAITLEEAGFTNYEIVATDISPSVIERAKIGKYSQFEVQRGMQITMLVKYFTQDGPDWVVKDNLKRNIKFSTFNLLDSYMSLGNFDLVFCRNVLIYFEPEVKAQILGKTRQLINPEGALYLGSSESILGMDVGFKNVPGETGMFEPV